MKKGKFKGIKSAGLTMISGVAFVLIIWLLFFGKIKIRELLSPLLGKVPKDEQGLTQATEGILGAAVEKLKGGNIKGAIQKGSQVFESSQLAEPARGIREDIKLKINDVIDSAKGLPAQEVKVVKEQVCKEWFPEEATKSGGN